MEPTLSSASLEDILDELGRRANIKPSKVTRDPTPGLKSDTSIGDDVNDALIDPNKMMGVSIVIQAMPKPESTLENPDYTAVTSCLGNPRLGLQFMERLAMAMIRGLAESDRMHAEREEDAKQAKMDKLLGADKAEEN